MKVNIRQETPGDHETVNQVIEAAFAKAEHADGNEHHLVARLRGSSAFVPELSLVAEVDGNIVGHILFTKIVIKAEEHQHEALALAPVSVHPDCQRHGFGAKLIEAGHKIATELGFGAVILLGHPAYYPKFGYRPASGFGIKAPFDVPDEAFMAIALRPGALDEIEGTVVYPEEFGI